MEKEKINISFAGHIDESSFSSAELVLFLRPLLNYSVPLQER